MLNKNIKLVYPQTIAWRMMPIIAGYSAGDTYTELVGNNVEFTFECRRWKVKECLKNVLLNFAHMN